jgi:hypothetical protein
MLKKASFFPWIQGNLHEQMHLLFFIKNSLVHSMMAHGGGGTGPITLNIGGKLR